jgi:hypothetical protein
MKGAEPGRANTIFERCARHEGGDPRLNWLISALGGTRSPNLLIRSKIALSAVPTDEGAGRSRAKGAESDAARNHHAGQITIAALRSLLLRRDHGLAGERKASS